MSRTDELIDRLRATGSQVVLRHRLHGVGGGAQPTKVEEVEVDADTSGAVNSHLADVLVDHKGRIWLLSPARGTMTLGFVGDNRDPLVDAVKKAITAKPKSTPKETP